MKLNRIITLMVFASGSIMAAETVEHTITVTAQIPSENFYVTPVGDWMSSTQKLQFNPNTQKLDTLSRQMEVKSTIGPIKGYLLYKPALSRVNGNEEIGLTVNFAGVALTTESQDLLTLANVQNGKKVGFEVIPDAAPNNGYKAGSYQGVINMVFESEAPPAPPAPQE
ncbi:CS1 type fimbrial major subunit [Vibrio sp. V10_P2A27P122]|uniref:CS1 type fimbrial major subunit n=3 Tax=unclassified Vibrio TaxID=2614977 RepID=UPI000B8E38C5|nr:CS1 type fimbrial major subunit [Vibrio sp. V10_P2A27P122]OXX52476.1 adhesin [Vibrio sp. V10_P2A27P122]